MDFLTLTLIIIVSYLICRYLTKNSGYFEKLGVPYLSGWPVFGYMGDLIFRRRHLTDIIKGIYDINPEAKYVGMFEFSEPVFLLRDLELIRDVTIKNFDNFPDHKPLGDESLDPLFGGSLFNLLGQKWKDMRSTLSPSFTSSKMKMMFHLMVECSENFVTYMEKQPNSVRRMIDVKNLFTRYANDVIATCGFGVRVDSLNQPKNDFYVLGRKANLEGVTSLKLFLSRSCPGLMKFFKIRIFGEEVFKFFTQLVANTVNTRDKEGITRPDMMQLLMEARKTSDIDIAQMTAQAFIFFLAGFDTTSSTICMLAHELALHPDIQEKLQNEIDGVMEECNKKPSYEAIQNMTYLDAVFNEVNRLHGQGHVLDRVCKVSYQLPPALPGAKPIKLEPGMRIYIPTWSIHRDPNYYPEPNKFNPDRYLDKKVTLSDVLNMSFGIGPRACIGNRFAILEIKVLFVYLLSKFTFKTNEKTCIPTKYSKATGSICLDGGCWLSIVPR